MFQTKLADPIGPHILCLGLNVGAISFIYIIEKNENQVALQLLA